MLLFVYKMFYYVYIEGREYDYRYFIVLILEYIFSKKGV